MRCLKCVQPPLAKQDSLPKTLTETTELLIVYTVCRQLKKSWAVVIWLNR